MPPRNTVTRTSRSGFEVGGLASSRASALVTPGYASVARRTQALSNAPTAATEGGDRAANLVDEAVRMAQQSRHSPSSTASRFRPPTNDSDFSARLETYRLGSWGNRRTYLPTLENVDEQNNPKLVGRFRELVEVRGIEQLRILLHSGVSPNLAISPPKRTALHIAAERGDELMCQLLLSFKADPLLEDETVATADDSGHWTPRAIARKHQHLQVIHLFNAHCGFEDLLDVGPNPGPPRFEKPMRLDLRAHEPGFMSSSAEQPCNSAT